MLEQLMAAYQAGGDLNKTVEQLAVFSRWTPTIFEP